MKRILVVIALILLAALMSAYTIWVPYIQVNDYSEKIGMGMVYAYMDNYHDADRVSWVYNWGDCSLMPTQIQDKCVPMAWAGIAPDDVQEIGEDYDGWLLVFNEPDNPNQADLDAEEAVDLYMDLKADYPDAKMVVGNVTAISGWGWLYDFIEECESRSNPSCELPNTWGLHGYMEGAYNLQVSTADGIITILTAEHNLTGGDIWVTEWAETHGFSYETALEAKQLREFLENTTWIKRWAYFTSRADGDEDFWPENWEPTMLWNDTTGARTLWGDWFFAGYIPYPTATPEPTSTPTTEPTSMPVR